MRANLFFLCICFLLLKVTAPLDAIAAAGHHGYSRDQHSLSSELATAVHVSKDLAIVAASDNAVTDPSFLADDEEENEENDYFSRRFRVLARSYTEFCYQPAFGNSINRSKTALSFFGRISYKYLQQRVIKV